MLFNSELALVNRERNKKWPDLEPYMAQYSGQARWVHILRRRVDRVMTVSAWSSPNSVVSERLEGWGTAPERFPEESSRPAPMSVRGVAGSVQ